MPSIREFLDLTSDLKQLGEVQAIDASGYDRIAASRKYANRTDYTFQALKPTMFVENNPRHALFDEATTRHKSRPTAAGEEVPPGRDDYGRQGL